MVWFEKDKFVIEVKSVSPVEDWLNLVKNMLHIVSITDKSLLDCDDDPLYDVCWLLESMFPGATDALKMEVK